MFIERFRVTNNLSTGVGGLNNIGHPIVRTAHKVIKSPKFYIYRLLFGNRLCSANSHESAQHKIEMHFNRDNSAHNNMVYIDCDALRSNVEGVFRVYIYIEISQMWEYYASFMPLRYAL